MSTTGFYGLVYITDNLSSSDPASDYTVRMDPTGANPVVGFRPTGVTDEMVISTTDVGAGVVNMAFIQGATTAMTLYGAVTNGTTVNIPSLNSGGTVLSSPISIAAVNASGDVGRITSVPVVLGGTGLTAPLANDTLYGSDGTGVIAVSAGSGISISGGVITAVPIEAPTFTSLTMAPSPIPPPGTSTTIAIPSSTIGSVTTPVIYTANAAGSAIVATITTAVNTVQTVHILSARYDPAGNTGGSGLQQFRILRDAGAPTITNFGSATGTAPSSVVALAISVNDITLSITLANGEVWKGNITVVRAP